MTFSSSYPDKTRLRPVRNHYVSTLLPSSRRITFGLYSFYSFTPPWRRRSRHVSMNPPHPMYVRWSLPPTSPRPPLRLTVWCMWWIVACVSRITTMHEPWCRSYVWCPSPRRVLHNVPDVPDVPNVGHATVCTHHTQCRTNYLRRPSLKSNAVQ